MLRVFYMSAANRFATARELNILLAAARARNHEEDLTGVLLYHDGSFAQVLEGPDDCVHACFTRIQNDPRHSGCTLILEEKISRRLFNGWPMEIVTRIMPDTAKHFGFMTPQEFYESQPFIAARRHLVLKSFLQSFTSKPKLLRTAHLADLRTATL